MRKFKIVFGIFCAAVLVNGCGGSIDLGSKWADEPVQTDGSADQWKGKTTYVKEGGLLIGVQNDSDNIYIALTTSDPASKQQIIMRGLTVWFDTQGGDNKTFGIKYPIGARDMGLMNLRKGQDENNGNNQDWLEQMEDNAVNSTTLEVMNSDDDGMKMELADASGVTVKLTRSNDVLIYELKIAMKESAGTRYSIGINSIRQIVGVGFETGVQEENRKNGDNEQRGNMGRGNHGRGNRNKGSYSNNRQSIPDPVKQWFTVQLAKNSDVKIK
jgi:hypothetical protein